MGAINPFSDRPCDVIEAELFRFFTLFATGKGELLIEHFRHVIEIIPRTINLFRLFHHGELKFEPRQRRP